MKVILLSFLLITAPEIFAEGVASMTTVTATNGKSLAHHGLAVICKSQHGRSSVDLVFRPQKDCPFVACSVTIHDQKGQKILVHMNPEIRRALPLEGLPEVPGSFFMSRTSWSTAWRSIIFTQTISKPTSSRSRQASFGS
ncbi:MAG: hypothetical protein V4819_03475 [Verrucomicrobiota bacterium]